MEKLDKVIAGMEACRGVGDNCNRCPYVGEDEKCSSVLWADTLAVLKARKGDLISRRARIKKMFSYGMPDGGNYGINAKAVMVAITGAAGVEVEPVVYGRWIIHGEGYNNWCECSECNTVGSPFWKRCPMCEAKMLVEVKDGKAR